MPCTPGPGGVAAEQMYMPGCGGWSWVRSVGWIVLAQAFAEHWLGDFPDRVLGQCFLDVDRA